MSRKLRTKAAVLPQGTGPIQFWEWDVPLPAPGCLNVEVVLGGVCGTEHHLVRRESEFPVAFVLGHEGVGRIVELADDVKTDHAGVTVSIGDLVYWRPMSPCYRCFACTVDADFASCIDATSWLSPANQPTWATFNTISTLKATNHFFKIKSDCPPEAVIALGCALPTILQGMERVGGITFGSSVAIQGAGPLGLAAIMQASLAGASKIIIIEKHAIRLEMALRFGATHAIDMLKTPSISERLSKIKEITAEAGVDLVVEASGSMSAFEEGVPLLARNGRYLLPGTWAGEGRAGISPFEVCRKAVKIVGTSYGSPKHYYHAMKLAETYHNRFPLVECITHRLPLLEVGKALELVVQGQAIKVVIVPPL